MRLLSRCRPSPALVVAMVALVIAASGTSFASTLAKALGLSGKQKTQVTKIADTQIRKKSSSLSVKNADTATTAGHAATADTATAATTALNATELGGKPPAAFLGTDKVLSSGIKVVPNTGTTATPVTLLTLGTATVTGSCTLNAGSLALTVDLHYPANSVTADSLNTAAGQLSLDSQSTAATTFVADSSGEGDFTAALPKTVLLSDGSSYQLIEGWDALNYTTAGSCGFQLYAVQG